MYIAGRSQPSKGLYFYAYRIRITNLSDRPVQLLRRHWIITDANGKTETVQLSFVASIFFFCTNVMSRKFNYPSLVCRGTGVIGEQPVILPKTGFEYSSACPLSTSTGRMVRRRTLEIIYSFRFILLDTFSFVF